MIQMSFSGGQQLSLRARRQRMLDAAILLTAIKPISVVQAFPRDQGGSRPEKWMRLTDLFIFRRVVLFTRLDFAW